jgi:hypothetical protein
VCVNVVARAVVSRTNTITLQGLLIPLQIIMGAGIGMFMQILTTMAQNEVEMREMAVVTTGA